MKELDAATFIKLWGMLVVFGTKFYLFVKGNEEPENNKIEEPAEKSWGNNLFDF